MFDSLPRRRPSSLDRLFPARVAFSMYSLKLSGLSLSTNLLKHPRLALGTSHKAAPTVSLSNTHVERDTTTHSSIPFPSAPIQCPGSSAAYQDVEMTLEDAAESSPSSEDWHLELARKHSQSCLATSFVHRDGHAMPYPVQHTPNDGQTMERTSVPVRKRKLANRRPKLPSTTTCQPPRKKSKRGSKRQTTDLQFIATLHRSLVTHLRTSSSYTLSPCETNARDDELALHRQDRILIERLWKGLIDQGLQPVHFPSPLPPSALPTDTNPFILNTEHVEHVFQSEPLAAADITSLPAPPPSPISAAILSSAPIAIPPSNGPEQDDFRESANAQSLPRPPRALLTPPATSQADVLAMPQLVASLILRHRERSTTRPRSGSACSAGVRAERGRSPLSTSVLAPPSGVSRAST
jgi:hypothetical protein